MNLYAMNQLEDGNYHFFPEKGDEQINRVRIIGLITNYWTDYGTYVYSDITESI